jgi:hypothetical protein
MYTCYDCEKFGNGCQGMIPPSKYRNNLEDYCKKFEMVAWRKEMFKEGGTGRLTK